MAGKGKLILGIVFMIVGVTLISAGDVLDNRINEQMDLSIPEYLFKIRDWAYPTVDRHVKYEAIPDTMEALKDIASALIPEMVNTTVSLNETINTVNDLSIAEGMATALDWFFNDPAWSTTTSGVYDIQGISEFGGLGDLSFTPTAQSLFIDEFANVLSGPGIYSVFDELENIPSEFASFSDGGEARDLFVTGSRTYVAKGTDGLEVLNTLDLPTIAQWDQHDDGGEANGVFVVGTTAYVADGSDGLEIIDCSTAFIIDEVGQYDSDGTAYGVHVANNRAYVADGLNGLVILDVSDPSDITEYGHLVDGGEAYDVSVIGDLAYIADGSNGLEILNISNPANPVEIGSFDDGGVANALTIMGNYAFIADGSDGLEIIDITDKTNPTQLAQLSTTGGDANDIYISENHAYLALDAGFEIIDISSLGTPVSVGYYMEGLTGYGIQKRDNYLLIATGNDGLVVYDITHPSAWYDLTDRYDSTMDQILNVTTYITDHLFPSVPSFAGLPGDANSTTAEEYFFMQWTEKAFIETSWEIPLETGSQIIDWELDFEGLTPSTINTFWNSSDSNSPFNDVGIKKWIWVNETTEVEIRNGLGISSVVYDALIEYLFNNFDEDYTFGNTTIGPLIEVVENSLLLDVVYFNFYQQWAVKSLFPEGLHTMGFEGAQHLEGFEAIDYAITTFVLGSRATGMWDPENTLSLTNPRGVIDWLSISRMEPTRDDEIGVVIQNSIEYAQMDSEFNEIGVSRAKVMRLWMQNFRNEILPTLIVEDGGYFMNPIELANNCNMYGLTVGGLITFTGIILIIAYRKR